MDRVRPHPRRIGRARRQRSRRRRHVSYHARPHRRQGRDRRDQSTADAPRHRVFRKPRRSVAIDQAHPRDRQLPGCGRSSSRSRSGGRDTFCASSTRIEAALRAEKERAQATLASLGESVISTDVAGRVVYMNAAAERLLARHVERNGPRNGADLTVPPEVPSRREWTTDIFADGGKPRLRNCVPVDRAARRHLGRSVDRRHFSPLQRHRREQRRRHSRQDQRAGIPRPPFLAGFARRADRATEPPRVRAPAADRDRSSLAADGAGHALDVPRPRPVQGRQRHLRTRRRRSAAAPSGCRAAQAPAGDGRSGAPGRRRVCVHRRPTATPTAPRPLPRSSGVPSSR